MVLALCRSVLVLLALLAAAPAVAQQDPVDREIANLPWRSSPSVGPIASVAQIRLGRDIRFLDPASTSRFLELNGNPPTRNHYLIAPRSGQWFGVFAFDPSGYVRDDERLDPDELLRDLRRQNEDSIAERRRLGLEVLRLDGWAVAPHYDVQTRRLEWGTRLLQERGGTTVNYTTRILGRTGVTRAILVSSSENLDQNIREFRAALEGFGYVSGEGYSEFRQGDRVAEYGLAALVVGGAAAAASKAGLFKGFGKLVGVGALAAFATVGSFVRRLFGRNKASGA